MLTICEVMSDMHIMETYLQVLTLPKWMKNITCTSIIQRWIVSIFHVVVKLLNLSKRIWGSNGWEEPYQVKVFYDYGI